MTMNQLQSRWQAHQSARSEYDELHPKDLSLCERIRVSLARDVGTKNPAPAALAA
jgi:hypothetical protein